MTRRRTKKHSPNYIYERSLWLTGLEGWEREREQDGQSGGGAAAQGTDDQTATVLVAVETQMDGFKRTLCTL